MQMESYLIKFLFYKCFILKDADRLLESEVLPAGLILSADEWQQIYIQDFVRENPHLRISRSYLKNFRSNVKQLLDNFPIKLKESRARANDNSRFYRFDNLVHVSYVRTVKPFNHYGMYRIHELIDPENHLTINRFKDEYLRLRGYEEWL